MNRPLFLEIGMMTKDKFTLGKLFATPGVFRQIPTEEVAAALSRHRRGDWGLVAKSDHEENELALKEGFRLFSVYESKQGTRFWVITEADWSATTVLLPDEY